MENLSFDELIEINCFSTDDTQKKKAGELLELKYCFEIHCMKMDKSVKFAHHGRGCTIVAAKLSKNVVIYQNVTMGSNLKFNRKTSEWENVGSPIIDENVIICDGAKVLGPVVVGKNSLVAAGAIVTKDVPENSIVYGVNQIKDKDNNYDYVFNENMISASEIEKIDKKRVLNFEKD